MSRESASSDSVKSVTLAELIAPPAPPPRRALPHFPAFGRVADFARKALMAWGIISLGAVAGMTAYYRPGGPDTLLLARETVPTPAREATAPPRERLAALLDAPQMPAITSRFTTASSSPTDSIPIPLVEARLPRPRPDEPIFTGSIAPSPAEPSYGAPSRRASLDPCAALKNLGAPYLFGNRCGRYTHFDPPPPRYDRAEGPQPRQYYPHPYQPPQIIAD